jgi:dTMP kinase
MAQLALRLRSQDVTVVETREPGGTELGLKFRSLLLDRRQTIQPETELLLYAADRAEHHARVIVPALDRGEVILCDRHLDSTIAYQGHARGLSGEWIRKIHAEGILQLRPHRTIWLDLAVEESLLRARRRTEEETPEESRFEDEELNFHRLVREGYAAIAAEEPERIIRIDASGTLDAVASRIDDALQDLLGGHRT